MLTFFTNHACLWGSYSLERNSISETREGGSPVTLDRFPPRFNARSPILWTSTFSRLNRFCPPWDQARKTRCSNASGHNRSTVSGTWAENESLRTNVRGLHCHEFVIYVKNHESGCLGVFEVWEFLPGSGDF